MINIKRTIRKVFKKWQDRKNVIYPLLGKKITTISKKQETVIMLVMCKKQSLTKRKKKKKNDLNT